MNGLMPQYTGEIGKRLTTFSLWKRIVHRLHYLRLEHLPLFGKGARWGTQTRHERAAEIEPKFTLPPRNLKTQRYRRQNSLRTQTHFRLSLVSAKKYHVTFGGDKLQLEVHVCSKVCGRVRVTVILRYQRFQKLCLLKGFRSIRKRKAGVFVTD